MAGTGKQYSLIKHVIGMDWDPQTKEVGGIRIFQHKGDKTPYFKDHYQYKSRGANAYVHVEKYLMERALLAIDLENHPYKIVLYTHFAPCEEVCTPYILPIPKDFPETRCILCFRDHGPRMPDVNKINERLKRLHNNGWKVVQWGLPRGEPYKPELEMFASEPIFEGIYRNATEKSED